MVYALLSLLDPSIEQYNYTHTVKVQWLIVFNFFSSAAVVGLEETFYRVSEGVGFVEVCAIVYHPNGNLACPIDFAFEADFSTSDGSAGSVTVEFHNIHVFFLQCLPWTMVLLTLLYHLMHVTHGVV